MTTTPDTRELARRIYWLNIIVYSLVGVGLCTWLAWHLFYTP